jgi:hypothetical protein
MDRVYELGFGTLEQYESHFRHLHPETSTDEADKLWAAELQMLRSFTNGRSDYIPLENTHIQYGKHGLFASLDLGVSWKVGDSGRMSAAICTGLSQSYYGTCLRTQENEILHFGRVDYLPYEKGQQKVLVRTVGHEDFMDSFDVDIRVKIGFAF